jgi:hypothetical protein
LEKEIRNNTDEAGVLQAQSVCIMCHAKKTWGSKIRKKRTIKHEKLFQHVVNHKIKLSKCSYEYCIYPEVLCLTEDDCILFNMDHLHVKGCKCGCDPKDRKIENISTMVNHSVTLEDLEIELQKCRLVHAACHRLHTQEQHNGGFIRKNTSNTTL